MNKAIFYKEWIKTRWYFLAAILVSCGFTVYCLLKINRVVNLKGATHIWEVMLERDAIFIDQLTYIPLVLAILFALVQFIPEMQQKRLKLTLHLPVSHNRSLLLMLAFGMCLLLVCYLTNFAIMGIYLPGVFAHELVSRMLLTALTWYLAGLAGYLFTAWICLEPTWKRRVINLLVAAGVLRIFFLSSSPEAYNKFFPVLIIYIVLLFLLPMWSIQRFKIGKQD